MNPAKIGNSRYKQGYYVPTNKSKYIGDVSKIIYRSGWERKVCYKLDHADYVIGWGMEPFPIWYVSPKDGQPHRYFTDFIVVSLDKYGEKQVTLIEVKPYKEQFPPVKRNKKKSRYLTEAITYEVNQAKWAAAKKLCAEKGWAFQVLTEKEILGK